MIKIKKLIKEVIMTDIKCIPKIKRDFLVYGTKEIMETKQKEIEIIKQGDIEGLTKEHAAKLINENSQMINDAKKTIEKLEKAKLCDE